MYGYKDNNFVTALTALFVVVGWVLLLGIVVGTVFLFAPYAHARDDGQWGNNSAQVRDWFQKLMQPDNPAQSCCGEADAFEADTFEIEGDHYVAVVTDGKGVIPNGTHISVPNSKMNWGNSKPNPTGHGIIFLSGVIGRPGNGSVYVNVAGQTRILYCYAPPTGI